MKIIRNDYFIGTPYKIADALIKVGTHSSYTNEKHATVFRDYGE